MNSKRKKEFQILLKQHETKEKDLTIKLQQKQSEIDKIIDEIDQKNTKNRDY